MNGKIDANGFLRIERGGKLKTQHCPLCSDDRHCGDRCPLFGEPTAVKDNKILPLCGAKTLYFDDFTDDRGGK
jgi:hypothetical protein